MSHTQQYDSPVPFFGDVMRDAKQEAHDNMEFRVTCSHAGGGKVHCSMKASSKFSQPDEVQHMKVMCKRGTCYGKAVAASDQICMGMPEDVSLMKAACDRDQMCNVSVKKSDGKTESMRVSRKEFLETVAALSAKGSCKPPASA